MLGLGGTGISSRFYFVIEPRYTSDSCAVCSGLPNSLGDLKALKELSLYGCTKLESEWLLIEPRYTSDSCAVCVLRPPKLPWGTQGPGETLP